MKRYRNISTDRWLRFPDGQAVGPGTEFQRNYNPEQEFLHKVGGFIEELSEPVTESKPVSRKREATPDPGSLRMRVSNVVPEGRDA
jgi:hypothetical protein